MSLNDGMNLGGIVSAVDVDLPWAVYWTAGYLIHCNGAYHYYSNMRTYINYRLSRLSPEQTCKQFKHIGSFATAEFIRAI